MCIKIFKTQYSNVPSFVPLISNRIKTDKYDPTVYKLGRELHKLTRYAFDKLKENPNMNIKDIFNKIHKQKDQVKFGNINDPDNPDDLSVDKLIEQIKNEHYNHSINTLNNELKLVQDTIIDIQKDIQTIKEFIVTYKALNNNQCSVNETENILETLKKDVNTETENPFSKLKFGGGGGDENDENLKRLVSLFQQRLKKRQRSTNGHDGEEKKEEEKKEEEKKENTDDDKVNVTAEAQLDMNDTKNDDNKMCMINVNMPVIHTAPVTEYAPQPSQNQQVQPQQNQALQNTQNQTNSPERKRKNTGAKKRGGFPFKAPVVTPKQDFTFNPIPVVNENETTNPPLLFPFNVPPNIPTNTPIFKTPGHDIFPNRFELGQEQDEQIPTDNPIPFQPFQFMSNQQEQGQAQPVQQTQQAEYVFQQANEPNQETPPVRDGIVFNTTHNLPNYAPIPMNLSNNPDDHMISSHVGYPLDIPPEHIQPEHIEHNHKSKKQRTCFGTYTEQSFGQEHSLGFFDDISRKE